MKKQPLNMLLQSMKDLGIQKVVIRSDLHDLIEVVMKQSYWPRFRAILLRISVLCAVFSSLAFETESSSSNRNCARRIAKSVLRDDRFQSYLVLGRPAWLHLQIFREAALIHT